MSTPTPRIRLSATDIARGEIIELRTMVTHPMEPGTRRDQDDRLLPRNILHSFRAEFGGEVVFEAALEPAIAANPFLQFSFAPLESGTLRLVWLGEDGLEVTATEEITVT